MFGTLNGRLWIQCRVKLKLHINMATAVLLKGHKLRAPADASGTTALGAAVARRPPILYLCRREEYVPS